MKVFSVNETLRSTTSAMLLILFCIPYTCFGMVLQKKIGLDRDDYTKLATATWCSGQYAGLLLTGIEFDAAVDFDFILYVLGS